MSKALLIGRTGCCWHCSWISAPSKHFRKPMCPELKTSTAIFAAWCCPYCQYAPHQAAGMTWDCLLVKRHVLFNWVGNCNATFVWLMIALMASSGAQFLYVGGWVWQLEWWGVRTVKLQKPYASQSSWYYNAPVTHSWNAGLCYMYCWLKLKNSCAKRVLAFVVALSLL